MLAHDSKPSIHHQGHHGAGEALLRSNPATGAICAVALSVATHAYVLMRGAVVLEGDPKDLAASPQLKDAYLGMASEPPSAKAKQGTS